MRHFPLVILFLALLGVLSAHGASWIIPDDYYEDGQVWDNMTDEARLAAVRQAGFDAKRQAFTEDRPLLICVGNKTCPHCANAWSRVLGTAEFAAEADARRLVLLEVYSADNASDFKFSTYSAAKGDPVEERGASSLPYFALVRVKSSFQPNAVFDRTNVTLLGIWPCNDDNGNLTLDWMTSRLDKYLAADSMQRLTFVTGPDMLPTAVGADGVDIYQNSAWNASTPASLNYTRELHFKFDGLAGRRHFFAVTGFPERDDFQLTLAIYNEKGTTCLKSTTGTGFTPLDRGFYFDPEEDGTYQFVISRDGAETESGLDFTLRNHIAHPQTADNLGTISNPFWSGCENGKWTMDLQAARRTGRPYLVYFTGLCWCPYCIALDNMAFSSDVFQDAVKDYPLVCLDARRRGEITGPSLLYTEGYQQTIRDAVPGLDDEQLAALIEEKLAANQLIQYANLTPGGTRIGYPTLIVCRPNGDDGMKLDMVGRASSFTTYPVTQDFAERAAAYVNAMTTLLQEEDGEESNNFSATCPDAGTLSAGGTLELSGYLGSCDLSDWSAITLEDELDLAVTIAVPDNADGRNPDAALIITLADENGATLVTATGTIAAPPALEYRGTAGQRLLALATTAVQQDKLVPYTLTMDATCDFPPYDICFPDTLFFSRACDSQFTIPVQWTRCEDTDRPARFTVTCENPDTLLETIQATASVPAGDSSGIATLTFAVKPDTSSRQARAYRLTLASDDGSCRINGESEARARIVFYPQFLELTTGGTKKIDVVQGIPVSDLRFALINGTTDTTSFSLTSGKLPKGLTAKLTEPDENHIQYLQFTGTPSSTAQSSSATITLYAGTRQGSKHTFSFTVASLESLNRFGLTNLFGGTLTAPDGTITSFALSLDSSRHLTATISDGRVFTAPNWTLDKSSNLVATLTDDNGQSLQLSLSPNGVGTGELSNGQETASAAFAPAADTAQYAGRYNISIQTNDYPAWGFASFTIDGQGFVSLDGTMPDGSTLAATSVLTGGATSASFTISAPTSVDGAATGQFTATIALPPADQRPQGQTCVTASTAVWRPDGDDAMPIAVAGNPYDPEASFFVQTAADAAQPENAFHFEAGFDLEGNPAISPTRAICALLPQGVPASEAAGAAFAFADDLHDGIQLQLAYDTATGRLTGTFHAFSPDDFSSIEATLQGILIPIPDCPDCSGQTIVVGCGQFFLGNDRRLAYPFQLLLGDYQHTRALQTPVFADDSIPRFAGNAFAIDNETEISFICGNPQDALLFFKDGRLLPGEPDQRSLTATPDDTGAYTARAARLGRLSQPLAFSLGGPAASFTAITADAPAGWHLLAIPAGYLPDTAQAAAMFDALRPLCLDEATGVFTRATDISAGHAYFLFLPPSATGRDLLLDCVPMSQPASNPSADANPFRVIWLGNGTDPGNWLWDRDSYRMTTDDETGRAPLTGIWTSTDK